jgi:hypothetical protein
MSIFWVRKIMEATYKRIFELKYSGGWSTCDLMQRFPRQKKRVCEIALLDVPRHLLRQVMHEPLEVHRLEGLKKKLKNGPPAKHSSRF